MGTCADYNKLVIKKDLIQDYRRNIKCKLELDCLEKEISRQIGNKAVGVIWLMHCIVWVKFEDGHFKFDDDYSDVIYWQELRVFNDDGEVQLVKDGDTMRGRCVLDKEGTVDWKEGYVDSIAPMWGSKNGYKDGFVYLEDKKRKINMKIPCDDGYSRYGLVTRSYIMTDGESGLSGYVDYRYLAIKGMEV